jgi:hypothetical protein
VAWQQSAIYHEWVVIMHTLNIFDFEELGGAGYLEGYTEGYAEYPTTLWTNSKSTGLHVKIRMNFGEHKARLSVIGLGTNNTTHRAWESNPFVGRVAARSAAHNLLAWLDSQNLHMIELDS